MYAGKETGPPAFLYVEDESVIARFLFLGGLIPSLKQYCGFEDTALLLEEQSCSGAVRLIFLSLSFPKWSWVVTLNSMFQHIFAFVNEVVFVCYN